VLKESNLDVLILQFGSSFFDADTDESDFDMVLVLRYKSLKESRPELTSTEAMREFFFFGTFTNALSSFDCQTFPVKNARNPILKVKVTDSSAQTYLFVDMSFAIVANSYSLETEAIFTKDVVGELQPIDEVSSNCIRAVRICQTIKDSIEPTTRD
jgi:hypothetical protein